MRAVIQNVPYEVRFRHTTLPGHDRRVRPTLDQAMGALSMVWIENKNPGIAIGLDIERLIEELVLNFVGSSLPKSHSTDCYILSVPMCSHKFEAGADCPICGIVPHQTFEQRLVSSGTTFCDKRDNFDRAEGRWTAFSKAIDAFPIHAEQDWIMWFADSPMRKPSFAEMAADYGVCDKPPAGWYCTRDAEHEGPCAARQAIVTTRTQLATA